MNLKFRTRLLMSGCIFAILASLFACDSTDKQADDSGNPGNKAESSTVTQPMEVSAEVPPTSAAEMAAWLAAGSYLQWNCETSPQKGRLSSPHGTNRICSNASLAASDSGAYPVGSAGVKELYSGDKIIGYAVYLKVAAGEGAATWYWYEKIGSSIIADGIGDKGSAKSTCVSCHAGAPRDHVFIQVK
jgi:hypothetical protein